PEQLPHPVVWIGKAIAGSEEFLRSLFPKDPKSARIAGLILALGIPGISFFVSALLLFLALQIHPVVCFMLNTFWSYQILATRCLEQESHKVYEVLQTHDLEASRKQIARLVGRDTSQLSEEEIIKACIETVAENTSDGVTAPLFYLLIGGAPFGFWYKAVNTLDSMVGYRNPQYQYFGMASAKLDDLANFIPSRLCACMMLLAVKLSGKSQKLNFHSAWSIFRRDRKNHLSPNSAQTESVAAGALEIQLGGTHHYFGEMVEKPTIGDPIRTAQPEDILKINRILILTAILSLVLLSAVRILILIWFIKL
ncbi:MAG: adenosylcobinamide-phosphate synthase CbiB, partial [Oscillospiraceae bacterium]|nr:adenosylcobinamide-phosphate synthase CbiB [Oscillospiraceae bacterium]